MSTEPDPEPLTPNAIVRRASMMGLGSSVTPNLRAAAQQAVDWFSLSAGQYAHKYGDNDEPLDELAAALTSVTPSEPTLDAAWKEAEAAADAYRSGSLRGASRPVSPMTLRRYGAGYRASAEAVTTSGPTPVAALLALAASLRGRPA